MNLHRYPGALACLNAEISIFAVSLRSLQTLLWLSVPPPWLQSTCNGEEYTGSDCWVDSCALGMACPRRMQ